MKIIRLTFLLAALVLAGCATAPVAGEKKNHTALWLTIGAVVVVGAIVASSGGGGGGPGCKTTIGGSGADFDFRCRPID